MPRLVLLVLLALSAFIAIAYGAAGSSLYEGAPPYVWPALFKASSIVILGLIALFARSRLLAAGLMFGAVGDALLAWSEDTFLYGALAFLIGHLFYIALFLRAGVGAQALSEPRRVIAMIAVVVFSIAMTVRLVPGESPLFIPLGLYTLVLTVMTVTSFTLPASRWLAMVGAVLFLISDGFVAANMFHPIADPSLAYWSSFTGWMIYWAGQAAICTGALGLHKARLRRGCAPRGGASQCPHAGPAARQHRIPPRTGPMPSCGARLVRGPPRRAQD